jgi:predicted MFS family arabinose efflux permease
MLSSYRRAYATPGSWEFSASAFVGRLPIAMVGLGIVLLISEMTGSYALAGALSAAFQLSAAGGSLVTSRWVDRLGQHRLLPWLALAHALGLVAFVGAVEADLSVVVQGLAAAFAGVTQPAIGSMVRARWAFVASPETLRSAFAIESIIDEFIFTVGPLLTAFLAFQVALPLPLIVAGVLTVAGSLALSFQRRTEPPGARASSIDGRPAETSAIRRPGMALMVVAAMGLGAVFGSYEVTVVAFSKDAGEAGASGLILGMWAAGSMLGGLYFGSRQWSMDLPRQVILLTGVLAVSLIPAPFVRSIPVLVATTFVAGVMVAPALIAIFSLTERLVPGNLLTEGLTWTNSGLALGFSLGTAVNGIVIDAHGTSVAFILPALCAAASCVAALFGRGTLQAACADRGPAVPGIARNSDPVPGPAPGGVRDDPKDASGRGHKQ